MDAIAEKLGYEPGLPPELAAALVEFDDWSKARLLIEQMASTPTETLYHYTGEEALRGILEKQHFWCFNHAHQSDPSEFAYSLGIARAIIREVGRSKDFFTLHFCACLDDLLEANELADPFDFYLVSFSRHRDHGPQWASYGKRGEGYAIGLGPSLFQPERDDLDPNPTRNLHVGRVIYGDAEAAARHREVIRVAAEITSRIGNANLELVRAARPAHYLVSIAREVLANQLVWNCLTAKNLRYADEREVRGIVMNLKPNFDPYRRSLGTRRYIEHELPLLAPGAVAEILVGPRAPADAEDRVRALLQANGYPEGIPVVRSRVSS
jgi:hypothetical protein